MMYFKTLHRGFIFAEVVMTIALVGFLLTALLTLQATMFKRVVINTFRIERFYPMKNLLITEPMRKDQKVFEKKDELFDVKLVYEKKEIKPISSLYRFKGLYQKQVIGTWFEQNREKTQVMLSYGFEINEKKK